MASTTTISKSRSVLSLLFRQTQNNQASASTSTPSPAITALAADILSLPEITPDPTPLLLSHAFPSLIRSDPGPSLQLLCLLRPRPLLALEVFRWRRKIATGPDPIPLSSKEYTKAISLAGHARNVDVAAALFSEAITSFPETRLYNALMSAYLYNDLTRRCLAVFESLRQDRRCQPCIASYNILLSLFGRSMLIDHMEAVLRALDEARVAKDVLTHNTIIAAYITAQMWDSMETAYIIMKSGPVKPDISTHLLMLRGYAHSRDIEKMEETFEIVTKTVTKVEVTLIRAMICAYCHSKYYPNRIKRIEELLEMINGEEYRRWLNVLLIRAYAQEDIVQVMERFIDEAFSRNTIVTSIGVMNAIISSFYRSNALNQLTGFIKRAEKSGWRICKSLYHCKMVMYGKQSQLERMHESLNEMERFRLGKCKQTLMIMYNAYSCVGRRLEADSLIGLLWKYGFENPHRPNMLPCR